MHAVTFAEPTDQVTTKHPQGRQGPSLQGEKYREMRRAILQVLSCNPTGIPRHTLIEAIRPLLSDAVYEPGSLTTWYCVNVQLDLEARGQIERFERGRIEYLRRVMDA